MNINVEKCVEYLRSVRIDISEEQAAAWELQQTNERARRRAHRRELKRSCGHFRTHICRVTSSEGTQDIRFCNDCRAAV